MLRRIATRCHYYVPSSLLSNYSCLYFVSTLYIPDSPRDVMAPDLSDLHIVPAGMASGILAVHTFVEDNTPVAFTFLGISQFRTLLFL